MKICRHSGTQGVPRKFIESDVAIVNGVIVKNRQGKNGGKIDDSLFIWDEELVSEHDFSGFQGLMCNSGLKEDGK